MHEASSRQAMPRQVVLFNLKFSPNLGDGIIAECLEHGLCTRMPDTRIFSVDLAGRQNWTAPGDGTRRLRLLRLIQAMPPFLRDVAVMLGLGLVLRRLLLPAWRKAVADADCAVFGGGQLIQDGDLNFPIKLAGAVGICHASRIPVAVYGVGAARSRSRLGRRLLRRLLASPRLFHVSARDAKARDNLACYAPSLTPGLVRDPGLLASRLWPVLPRPDRERRLVGLGITHPTLLRHHAHETGPATEDAAADTYQRIATGLIDAGFDVACFTNGAAEDEDFLARCTTGLRAGPRAGRVTILPRAATPDSLARAIAGFDGLVAHRLHAVIVAYSYAIPAIGLRWDGKLDAFFRSVGREGQVADFDEAGIAVIPDLMVRALAHGIDASAQARVLGDTEDGLDRLAQSIRDACKRPVTAIEAMGVAACPPAAALPSRS